MSVSDYSQVPRGTGEAALSANEPSIDPTGKTDLNEITSGVVEQLVAAEEIDLKQGASDLAAQIPTLAPEDQTTTLPTLVNTATINAETQTP